MELCRAVDSALRISLPPRTYLPRSPLCPSHRHPRPLNPLSSTLSTSSRSITTSRRLQQQAAAAKDDAPDDSSHAPSYADSPKQPSLNNPSPTGKPRIQPKRSRVKFDSARLDHAIDRRVSGHRTQPKENRNLLESQTLDMLDENFNKQPAIVHHFPNQDSRINVDKMQSPSASPAAQFARGNEPQFRRDVVQVCPPSPVRLGPSLGRSIEVDSRRNMDLGRAFRNLEGRCAQNNVKVDSLRQKFHERPGLKRKRLRQERWRKRFKLGFQQVVRRVEEMRRKGW